MSSFGENVRQAQSGNSGGSLATKLGFQDPDRKDPKHDEIVLWLDGLLEEYEVRDEFAKRQPWPCSEYRLTWEAPVGDPRWIAGFVDLVLEFDRFAKVFFEVKVQLPSLGDLIRQLRFYEAKAGVSHLELYVVSGDTRYVRPLARQGIGFVEYPTGEITHSGR